MAKDINNDNSFLIRLRSSVILMIITIASMLLGGEVLFFVLAAITVKGLTELYRVVDVSRTFAGIVGYIGKRKSSYTVNVVKDCNFFDFVILGN